MGYSHFCGDLFTVAVGHFAIVELLECKLLHGRQL